MWKWMSDAFPIVRKGYEPEAVEMFVKQQADAWRARVEHANVASEEWKRRAVAFEERVADLEERLRDVQRDTGERITQLETALAQARWARDQAQSELADERAGHSEATADAAGIVVQARLEASRVIAAAQEETERWFAAARRRIEMAEQHVANTLGLEVGQLRES